MTTSSGPLSPDQVAERARAMLDPRVDAVRVLARWQADLEAARQALQRVEAGHREAWRSTARAGWLPGQLRELGFTEPGAALVKKKGARRPAVVEGQGGSGTASAGAVGGPSDPRAQDDQRVPLAG